MKQVKQKEGLTKIFNKSEYLYKYYYLDLFRIILALYYVRGVVVELLETLGFGAENRRKIMKLIPGFAI